MGKITKTTDDFISESIAIHGDRYDYLNTVYEHSMKNLSITCRLHGDFLVSPNSHLSKKSGCSECTFNRRLTTSDFVKRSIAVHGDRYDYSKSIYVNYETPVLIVCKEHGEFWQSPFNHYSGANCPRCARRNDNLMDSRDEFIRKCRIVHGDKYDYSKVIYKGHAKTIILSCPIHGEFEQLANAHASGRGCRKCWHSIPKGNAKGLLVSGFIANARKVHGDTYDYSQVQYINSYQPVTIICRKHGAFLQRPDIHMTGSGCVRCVSSKGEKLIAEILESIPVMFAQEARFEDCRNKAVLPFDFYVPERKVLIEYHGYQHYQPIAFWGGDQKYQERKNNDRIKELWAGAHGYRLIVIPYTMSPEDIEAHLNEYI